MTDLQALAASIRESRGVAHKRDIAAVVAGLGLSGSDAVPVGDDTAVIPDPAGGNLLLAIEGFVSDFVAADPWFAGYCGVMVNLSDIAAMGGEAVAVVDALWADSAQSAAPILAGMREAAAKYGVPVVGGHSNLKAADGQLAVAILGRAARPITSFDAAPGDVLLVATDLRGAFRDPFPWWDASTSAPGERLRGDLAILPGLARDGLVTAGKDISMAGVVGTAMMLAEASGVGVHIDLDRLPMPEGVAIERWLGAFPSFGFVLTLQATDAMAVIDRFASRGIACAAVGTVTADRRAVIASADAEAEVWDFVEPFTGCTATTPAREAIDA
jgi:AIR synthase-related protein